MEQNENLALLFPTKPKEIPRKSDLNTRGWNCITLQRNPSGYRGKFHLPQGKKHTAKFCCNVAQTTSNCHWTHLTFILLVLPPGSGKRKIILATQHQHFWKSEYSWLILYTSLGHRLSNFTCRFHSESYHHQIKSFKILLILIIIIENKVF